MTPEKQLHLGICDDEQAERDALTTLLDKSGFHITYDLYCNAEDFLENYRFGRYDLLIMDIYMEDMTGVEAAKKVRTVDETLPLAFATTSLDHTLDSYRLNALKYLEKPITQQQMTELLQMALLYKENQPKLSVMYNRKPWVINFSDILFLEQKVSKTHIYLLDGRVLKINYRLTQLVDQFDPIQFIAPHKSYIVNLAYVKTFDEEFSTFQMVNDVNVHIRRGSQKYAKESFENYLFDKARRCF